MIPKHRLGSEYELDYALVRYSGQVDLVEIEASNLPLFNKKGNPSQHLVHAEQQVLDWLEWIEANGPYARRNLPDVYSPRGFVIIGRATALDEAARRKLNRRNAVFGDALQVLTYDDLLLRAEGLQKVLLETKEAA